MGQRPRRDCGVMEGTGEAAYVREANVKSGGTSAGASGGGTRTRLSSSVQTRRAHTLISCASGVASLRTSSVASHQHFRCRSSALVEQAVGRTAGLRQKSSSFCAVASCWALTCTEGLIPFAVISSGVADGGRVAGAMEGSGGWTMPVLRRTRAMEVMQQRFGSRERYPQVSSRSNPLAPG